MAVPPVPHTFTAGDNATSSVMQTLTDAGLYALGSTTSSSSRKPLALLRQTVAQSIASGSTGAAVTFDTEDVDYDNGHSTVTNPSRYTAQTNGWYWVHATVGFQTPASATGQMNAFLAVNGSEISGTRLRVPGSTVSGMQGNVGRLVFLNVGDYVEVWVTQNSGSAVSTVGGTGGFSCSASIEWRSN